MVKFSKSDLERLWKPLEYSKKGENGQVVIIGGSKLFHGAPVFAIKAASRAVDMVYFSSPEPELEQITAKSSLGAFIWVPWEDIEAYVAKSEAILIGPGMMRYSSESSKFEDLSSKNFDGDGTLTRSVTKYFLQKFPEKKWVIDGGSLQVMEKEWIPRGSVLTTNEKEFEMLFSTSPLTPLQNFGEGNQRGEVVSSFAKKYNCIIVHKGVITYVTDGATTYEIAGGNVGLTKGGTGDVQAGLTVGLLAKNEPLLAAATAAYLIKKTAEELEKKVGINFSADDVGEKIFEVFQTMTS